MSKTATKPKFPAAADQAQAIPGPSAPPAEVASASGECEQPEIGSPLALATRTPPPVDPTSDRRRGRPKQATIVVPLLEVPGRPEIWHVDLRLDAPRRRTLRALIDGLDSGDLRLSGGKQPGRRPSSNADALYWLLDQIGEHLPPRE